MNTNLTSQAITTFLTRLEELEKVATKGPWECQIPAMTGAFPTGKIKPLKIEGRLYGHPMLLIDDAEFIASLRNTAPQLLKALRVSVTGIQEAASDEYEHNGEYFPTAPATKARKLLSAISAIL